MVQSRDESSPSRIELVVLACLSQSKPPSDAELGDAVQQLALPGESAEAARRRALELLAELVRRAWVTGDDAVPRRGKQGKSLSPRKLTDSGRRVLRSTFNLARAPTWAQVRDKHLPSLALGLAPGSELASEACTESALMAAVLCKRFGIRDARTPVAVCDALIADALGMPRGKLTLDRIRAHVLSRGIDRQAREAPSPTPKGYAGKLAAWIACSTVDATGTHRNKTARALARRWVCGEANPLGVTLAPSGTGAAGGSTVVAPPQRAEQQAPPEQSRSMQPPVPERDVSGRSVESTSPGTPSRAPGNGVSAQPPVSVHDKPPPAPPRDRSTPPEPPGTERRPPPDVRNTQPPALLRGPVTQPAVPHTQLPLPNLLDVVRDAIPRIGAEGRFGEKVYVSAIWRTIERDRKAGDLSLDHFKRWLVGANRDGWLVLARADLIGAMDAKQVNESEINDRGATFHFVLDQRNGTSVSQREHHAR